MDRRAHALAPGIELPAALVGPVVRAPDHGFGCCRGCGCCKALTLGGREAGHETRANANTCAHEYRPAYDAIVLPFHIASPPVAGPAVAPQALCRNDSRVWRTAAGGGARGDLSVLPSSAL